MANNSASVTVPGVTTIQTDISTSSELQATSMSLALLSVPPMSPAVSSAPKKKLGISRRVNIRKVVEKPIDDADE